MPRKRTKRCPVLSNALISATLLLGLSAGDTGALGVPPNPDDGKPVRGEQRAVDPAPVVLTAGETRILRDPPYRVESASQTAGAPTSCEVCPLGTADAAGYCWVVRQEGESDAVATCAREGLTGTIGFVPGLQWTPALLADVSTQLGCINIGDTACCAQSMWYQTNNNTCFTDNFSADVGGADFFNWPGQRLPGQHAVNACDCPPRGACCDPSTLACEDRVDEGDCVPPKQFTIGTLCANLQSPSPCAPICGDGLTGGTEQCDPGPDVPGDCCSVGCTFEPVTSLCRPTAAKCDSPEACTGSSPDCPPDVSVLGCCVDDGDCPPDHSKCYDSFCNHGDPSDQFDNVCDIAFVPECRVSVSKKGSILYYSKIELKWSVTGTPPTATLIQDTFLTITNDYPEDVHVQWYFINGDAATAAVFSGSPLVLVERAHKGCNQVDCTTHLTEDESTYISALSGNPLGCQPFTILDRGPLPGRPDPESPGQRILRGYAIAFAVDNHGNEISWNHLSGHVDIVNYADRSAWEYNAYAFQCVANVPQGAECSNERVRSVAGFGGGTLLMDGKEYEFAFDKLLFDFYAVGSFAFSLAPTVTVQLDTDLTLYPVSVDLRTDDTDSDGPVLTRAKFDIWNQNEDAQSGVNRCINCWDQTLLSNYAAENSFLIGNLLTNKGKARIQGIESDDCDAPGACCNLDDDPDCTLADLERGTVDRDCSEDAALLGVSDRILFFSGPGIPAGARTDAGMTLVGQGIKEAKIKRDLIEPPDPLITGGPSADELHIVDVDQVSTTPTRKPNRSQRRIPPDKK